MKKKTLSKVLSTCAVLLLTASLAACGNKDTEPAAASAAATSEEASEEEKAEAVAEEEPEETVPEETQEPEETAAESEEEAEETAAESTAESTEETTVSSEILGTQTETTYVNDYFGLRYEAPADWYILTRDETATLMGLAESSVDNEKVAEMLRSTGYVTDFYAMATTPAMEGADSYDTVNITIQDVGKLYGILYDEKELAEASVDAVKEALGAQGLTDITAEVTEAEFLGKTCVASVITSNAGDFNMHQKQIYLKNGSMVACVTATSPGEDKTDEILAAFSANTDAAAAGEGATEEAAADTAGADAAGVAAGAIAEMPLSSGAISVDGDLFVLGSSFRDVQASGWALTPEDEEKYKEYTLNPRTTSGSAMGVYKDAYGFEFDSFHVMVSVMNASESSIPYLDGTIDYLSIPRISQVTTPVPVVFPGGLTTDSTEEEFIAVYGEPTYEYEDQETSFRSVEFEDGEVELQVTWVKGVINEITLMS